MNNVHAEKFVNDIKNAKSHLELTKYKVSDKVIIDDFNGQSITLRGCTFDKDVKFDSIDLSCGIRLIDCAFKGNIEFNNITISKVDFDLKDADVNDSLLLSNCKIERQFAIHNKSQIIRNIHIKDGSEINQLFLTELRCKEGGIQISNSTINEVKTFSQCSFVNHIRFDNCIFKGQIRFENNDTSDYSFINSIFEKDVWIWAGQVKRGVTFNGGEFKDTFRIEAIRTEGGSNLSIFDAKFYDTFTIDYEYYREDLKINDGPKTIWIKNSIFNNKLVLHGKKEKFSPYQLQKMHIQCTDKLKGEIVTENFIIHELIIDGTNKYASLHFIDNSYSNIRIEKFSNYSSVQFINLNAFTEPKEQPSLKINNSYLGQTQFINTSFKHFRVSIINSDVGKIILSNVIWFDLDQIDTTKIRFGNHWHFVLSHLFTSNKTMHKHYGDYVAIPQNIRETFRQLKFASEQQGNRIQALKFRQFEMLYYLYELRLSKKFFNQDRIILELGRSNSHGLNWVKPVLILLGITTVYTCIYAWYTSPLLGFRPATSWLDIRLTFTELWYNLNIFPKLLNPINSLDNIIGDQYSKSRFLNFLDVSFKIIYAFFVFQIISAFRKYIWK